jgi:hypothetical protein
MIENSARKQPRNHGPVKNAKKAVQPRYERLRDPLLTGLTIALSLLLFVVAPLQASGNIAAHYLGLAFSLVFVAAVFVVSANRLALAAILLAVTLAMMATILRVRHPSQLDIYLDASAWIIFGLTLTSVVAHAVFAPGKVTFHRVIGAVLLYLNIGLIFVALFCFVALFDPHAFNGLPPLQDNLAVADNLIYFSFVNLTSVGYGDIVPLHPFARSLANIESIMGQLYPATLIARLVSLELQDRNTNKH